MNFNTAISQMMIFINTANKEDVVPKEYVEGFLKLLNPVAPHITEELWNILGHNNSIAYEPWPTYDEAKTKESKVTLVVQINGKVRDKIEIEMGLDQEHIKELALNTPRIKELINNQPIKKVIVVPNKLVSIVL